MRDVAALLKSSPTVEFDRLNWSAMIQDMLEIYMLEVCWGKRGETRWWCVHGVPAEMREMLS